MHRPVVTVDGERPVVGGEAEPGTAQGEEPVIARTEAAKFTPLSPSGDVPDAHAAFLGAASGQGLTVGRKCETDSPAARIVEATNLLARGNIPEMHDLALA